MIPYSRQDISEDEIKSVTEVLKSDFLTQGPVVKKFENSIANKVNAKYAFAMNSATSALHIACLALGLNKGDILWTVPNSFVASANCGLYCGAKIDFVDIDPETYNISIEELESKLILSKRNNTLPKILIPVHFAGQPTDQEKIWELSKKFNFKILEDASHALGAKRNNIFVGENKWSDITVFSFHPVKMITSAEGGMALTNKEELAEKIDLYRTHGITRKHELFQNQINEPWYYEQLELGYNYRMSEVHAALGLAQIKKLNKFLVNRNKIAKIYDDFFTEMPISIPKINKGNLSSFHLYVIRLKIREIGMSYEFIFNKLRSLGIGVNLHYLPIHLHPYYKKLGFKENDFPVAESYAKEAMSIPIFPSLTNEQQNFVCEAIKETINVY